MEAPSPRVDSSVLSGLVSDRAGAAVAVARSHHPRILDDSADRTGYVGRLGIGFRLARWYSWKNCGGLVAGELLLRFRYGGPLPAALSAQMAPRARGTYAV